MKKKITYNDYKKYVLVIICHVIYIDYFKNKKIYFYNLKITILII